MPLRSAALASALEDLFEGAGGHPADEAEAGRRWAEAYRSYAAERRGGHDLAPSTPRSRTRSHTLAGTLAGGFTMAKAAGPGGVPALAVVMDRLSWRSGSHRRSRSLSRRPGRRP